jgi:hypothetical protein
VEVFSKCRTGGSPACRRAVVAPSSLPITAAPADGRHGYAPAGPAGGARRRAGTRRSASPSTT